MAKKGKFRWYFLKLAVLLIVIYLLQIFVWGFTDLFLLRSDVLFIEPWRLFTSMFLHGSWEHLLSNLVGFTLFGLVLEAKLGSKKALFYAVLTGLIANIIAGFFYPASLGASGLIFGLIGMLMILTPLLPVPAFGVPMPMIVAGIAWGVANIGGLFIESTTGYIAHLGGLFSGLVIGWKLRKKRPKRMKNVRHRRPVSDHEFSEWEKRHMKK